MTLSRIPKGDTKADKKARYDIILKALSRHVGKQYLNTQLSLPVICIASSIDEIAHHACKGYASTCAALHFATIVKHAKVVYVDLPKRGNQSKKFAAWLTIVMEYRLPLIGTVKLTVCDSAKYARKLQNDLVAYCITKA